MLNQRAHRDVVSAIHEFCRAFDQQDWTALRRCLAANLFVDYSSFRRTLPSRITADEFVALRQTALEGLVTQQALRSEGSPELHRSRRQDNDRTA